MKTFCKRHEVFYDAAGACADCAAMPVKTEPAKNVSLVITEGSPLDGLTVDPCKCGSVSLAGPGEDPIVRRELWNHSRNYCWVPAAFPFDPLPPMGSPEGKAEMERALGKTLISPDNALVRMVNARRGGKSAAEQLNQQILKETYSGIDRGELKYPQWKSAGEPRPLTEQLLKDAADLMIREAAKSNFYVDPQPALLRGMPLAEPLHDPATCKICRTINETPAVQQQQLAHDWDVNQDLCLRCRKTGMAIAAVPAFKYCAETPAGTYKPPVRARTGYGFLAEPPGIAEARAQLGFKRRQLAELQRQIDELASKIANASIQDGKD